MEARGDGSGEGDFRSALVSAIAGQTVYRNFELIHRKAGLKKKRRKRRQLVLLNLCGIGYDQGKWIGRVGAMEPSPRRNERFM